MTTNKGNSESSSLVSWGNLPDPRDPNAPDGARTEIRLDRQAWKHILKKHVFPGREPWDDVFSPAVFHCLVSSATTEFVENATVAEAVTDLERQVRESMNRPLVILYERARLRWGDYEPRSSWLLVLPSGAIAHVHQKNSCNRMATCYFPSYAVVHNVGAVRWRKVVAHLVVKYGIFDTERKAVRLPEPHTVKLVSVRGAVEEFRSSIRFVTPSSWGFSIELDGSPWRGRLASWAAAEVPTTLARRRLKPRRPRYPFEEDPSP